MAIKETPQSISVINEEQLEQFVWEWVEDCYNSSYEGAPADGRAWLKGDCVKRVDRGGAWYNKPEAVRSAQRYPGDDPTRRNNTLGFRVVGTLP